MGFIVSRNNRPNAVTKWLLREEGQPFEEAAPCAIIVARDVDFRSSPGEAVGFGCGTAAFCKEAKGYSANGPKLTKAGRRNLRFDAERKTLFDSWGKEVVLCPAVYFSRNGFMYNND